MITAIKGCERPEEAFVTLAHINAEVKTITLVYEGPSSGSKTENTNPNQGSSVILDVSIKPGMTVLWTGTFLVLFGAIVGIVRRWRI